MEFLGLIVSLAVLAFLLLPVLTFLRLARVSRELDELSARVQAMERASGVSRAQAEPVPRPVANEGPMPAPSAPVAPVTPVEPVVLAAPPDAAAVAAMGGGDTVPPLPERAATEPPDLESRIGGRGLLYTGVVVLLFGVSFFLKYAFDNAWINETGRVVLGAVAGVALVAGGLRLAVRGLAVFGQALAGTGLAVLYLAVFAALNFYGLIGPRAAFALLALITLGASLTADRQRSQALAFIAVGGGFLTPFLVGGDENAQLTLFTYLAILICGTLVLALRHQWLGLNALSYLFTFVTVVAWAGRYYTSGQWLRTLLFLTLFCVLFVVILRETRRVAGMTARLVTGLLATAPLFYHLAAVFMTSDHPPAIHIYLIAFTVGGLWLTADPHRPWIRLLILIAGLSPMFGSLTLPNGISWIVPNVVTIVAVAALHAMALLDRVFRQQARLVLADLLSLHLTGLGLFALLYNSLQPAYPGFRGGLAALIALGTIAFARSVRRHEPLAALNAVALAFTLAAIGVAVQFDGPAVIVGWAAEGAAVAWFGLRASSVAFQFGGLVLWAFAVSRMLDGYFATPAGFTALFNQRTMTTVFVVALGYALAWLFNRSEATGAGRTRAVLHVVCSALTMAWITAEIQSYWEVRYERPQAYLYKQVMLSLGWGLYGALLIALGMKRRYAPVRYIGITIIAGTIVKVFLYDLLELGGIYRVIGFLAFGILLVLVSYLYQKRRTGAVPQPPPSPPA